MSALATADADLSHGLERYLSKFWDTAVSIRNLQRIPGGASRETYSFDAEARGTTHGLILRRDPVGSLIDTNRQIEFKAYQSFQNIVPVPEPIALEMEGGPLCRPFFIMKRIDGGTAST